MAQTFGAAGSTPWIGESSKTANYQVTNADSGLKFDNTGAGAAVTFTLPTLANGVGCTFYFHATAAQQILITAPANKLIIDGNATATTCTYSTASHIIGSMAMVTMNAAGTFYVHSHLGSPANVVTVS